MKDIFSTRTTSVRIQFTEYVLTDLSTEVTKKYYIPILTSVRASSINIPDYASYPVHVVSILYHSNRTIKNFNHVAVS